MATSADDAQPIDGDARPSYDDARPSYDELLAYRGSTERRLRELAELMGRVAAGEYAARPELSANDDALSRFTVGFRFMLDDLELAHREQERRREELERANERLRFHTALLQSQAEAAIEGILVVDPDGSILSFNSRFIEMWGIPDDVIEARDDDAAIASVLHKLEDPDAFLDRVRYLYDRPDEEARDQLHLKDGRVFDRYTAPVKGPDDEHYGRVWFFRDVTAERRTEEQLRDANEQLQDADRLKTRFINTAAHELATPLTPIKLQLHLLRDHLRSLDDAHGHRVAVLDRNVDRLAALVRDVLDGARIQAGRLPTSKQAVEVGGLVHEAFEAFQAPARDGGVELEIMIEEGASRAAVHADPLRISQVLYNFVSNALKFTPKGGRVRIEAAMNDDHVEIRVHDTGRGLTRDQTAQLFQPFTQVHDTSTGDAPGTGLGLFICKGIVEEHGGRIWCHSDGPGTGCVFGFTVPLARDDGTDD